MRSLLTRLAALSVVAVAVAGCAGSTGTALPVAGPPNSSQVGAGNSQPNVTSPGGTGGVTAAAGAALPKLLDDGTVSKGAYVGYNVSATDTQSATNSTTDASPTNAPPEPSGATDAGSHAVIISLITTTQALITTNASYNLTFPFGGQTFTYPTLVAHFANLGGTAPSSISAEFVGGSGPTGFDVRVPCAGTLAPAAAFSTFKCALPSYAFFPPVNVGGPNAVNPAAQGFFTPTNAKVYFVLNYASVPASPTATIGIDNVYVTQ
ncbi:MAG: hypothetical protein NVSMB5_14810 [Candidatus Velthaea sp.]